MSKIGSVGGSKLKSHPGKLCILSIILSIIFNNPLLNSSCDSHRRRRFPKRKPPPPVPSDTNWDDWDADAECRLVELKTDPQLRLAIPQPRRCHAEFRRRGQRRNQRGERRGVQAIPQDVQEEGEKAKEASKKSSSKEFRRRESPRSGDRQGQRRALREPFWIRFLRWLRPWFVSRPRGERLQILKRKKENTNNTY